MLIWSKRFTNDMKFSVRRIQEKCNEQDISLHIAFIYFTKAFGLVSRKGLIDVLLKIGCLINFSNIVKFF